MIVYNILCYYLLLSVKFKQFVNSYSFLTLIDFGNSIVIVMHVFMNEASKIGVFSSLYKAVV